MIQDEFREIVFKFVRETCIERVKHIFLFGSVAKGSADVRSDIDFLVVLDADREELEKLEAREKISEVALSLERLYGRNIEIVFCDRNFSDLEDYFIERVLSEGVVLYSVAPRIEVKGLQLDCYALIVYKLDGLDPKSKMKINRAMFGYRSRKVVKGRVYTTEKKGVVAEVGGSPIGRDALIVPRKYAKDVEQKLGSSNVRFKSIDMWLSEDNVVKIYT